MNLLYIVMTLLAILPFMSALAVAQSETNEPILPHLSPTIPHLRTPMGPAPNGDTQAGQVPLPTHGETDAFAYTQVAGHEDVYRIQPTNGDASYLVSSNFLQLSLSKKISSEHQSTILRVYPSLVEKQFQSMMEQAFPDASQAFDEPFESEWFEGADGQQLQVDADPLAGPYVRLKGNNADGETFEFSVARHLVERLLEQENLTDEQLIHALSSIPFALPEAARHNFDRLSSADLAEMVQTSPDMQALEFVKMRGMYRQRQDVAVSDVRQPPTGAELQHVMSLPRHVMVAPSSIPHIDVPTSTPTPMADQQTDHLARAIRSGPPDMASTLPTPDRDLSDRGITATSGSRHGFQIAAMVFSVLGLALIALAYFKPTW